MIKYEYSKEFELLIVLFAIAELKSRTHYFEQTLGEAKLLNILTNDRGSGEISEYKKDAEV